MGGTSREHDEPTLTPCGGGYQVAYRGRPLYAGRDPVAAADRRAAAVTPEHRTLYIVPSPLLGYGIATLLQAIPADSHILAIEIDANLAHLTRERASSSLPAKERVTFVLRGDAGEGPGEDPGPAAGGQIGEGRAGGPAPERGTEAGAPRSDVGAPGEGAGAEVGSPGEGRAEGPAPERGTEAGAPGTEVGAPDDGEGPAAPSRREASAPPWQREVEEALAALGLRRFRRARLVPSPAATP